MYNAILKEYVDVSLQEQADLYAEERPVMQKGRVDRTVRMRKNSSLTRVGRKSGLKDTSSVPNKYSGMNRREKIGEHSEVIYGTYAKLDKTSINIVNELLLDPDIKSSDIARRLRIPLSTVQRRRANLESSSILRKAYNLDLARLGWREAELLVTVQKGMCRNIANQILTGFKNNVKSCTLRIGDPEVNVAADIIYRNSPELLKIVDAVKNMDFVSFVEWSEITEIVGKNNIDLRFLFENRSLGF